jgi:cobyrinic acid a,c-diamide synthase
MIITKKQVVDTLLKYINRQMKLAALVDWAEKMMQEAEFEDKNFEAIRDVVSRIGLADVREFGLSWDDCYDFLHRLGYDITVELHAAK